MEVELIVAVGASGQVVEVMKVLATRRRYLLRLVASPPTCLFPISVAPEAATAPLQLYVIPNDGGGLAVKRLVEITERSLDALFDKRVVEEGEQAASRCEGEGGEGADEMNFEKRKVLAEDSAEPQHGVGEEKKSDSDKDIDGFKQSGYES